MLPPGMIPKLPTGEPPADLPPLRPHERLGPDPAAVADGLEYALAAILDCHTRIVARHVPSPRVRRVRAGYRDRSLRAALALRSERR